MLSGAMSARDAAGATKDATLGGSKPGSRPGTTGSVPTALTRAQRVRRFGVDCADELVWGAGWEPGGEYTKQLVIKNVGTKVMKIKYQLPVSKYFSMAFPETINLTAGLSKTLQVVFRPIKLEEYDDCVQFFTEKGTFVVPIRAFIPTVSSVVPDHLDFGFQPVQETGVKTFTISNDGEVPVTFSWSFEPPFILSPRSGSMAPGASVQITARFTPTDASVYVAQCVCNIPEHRAHLMKIGGIGKYPFLTASTEVIEFGSVLTGTSITKEVKLMNKSLVYARYKIVRAESDVAPVYSFSPTSGIVPPDGEQSLQLTYSPQATGTYRHDRYEVRTPGGNMIALEAVGEAVGPCVELLNCSEHVKELGLNLINFGDVGIELPRRAHTRVLEVKNNSNVPVPFQLYGIETNGDVFSVKGATAAQLPPRLSTFLTIAFSPAESANYYRRVFVLIRNQAPLAVDLIGTGYNEKRRPQTMLPRHVSDYLLRELHGEHMLTPDALQERASARAEVFDGASVASNLEASASEDALMQKLFEGSNSQEAAVSFEQDFIDFGAGSRLRVAEAKTVRLHNRTGGKLSLQWAVPNGYSEGGVKDQNSPSFTVSPSSCDVLPHSSATFKVQFRPQSEQQYYCQRLECFASFKMLRTFRLVTEDNFAAPWCLSLCCHGHTFPLDAEQFIPKPVLSHPLLSFPSVHAGDTTYQTVSLKNEGDTPMMFHVKCDSAIFHVVPEAGVVPAGKTHLLAVRFRPPEVGVFERNISVILNNKTLEPHVMRCVGHGCRAQLSFANEGRLFCTTTCVGATSHALLRMTNPARLDVAYEWDLSPKMAEIFSLNPSSGILRGRESLELDCSFMPQDERQYLFKVPCLISAIDENSNSHEVVRQLLTISGTGSTGQLRAEPQLLDYGPVLIADTHSRPITLINSSAVDLYYCLTLVPAHGTPVEFHHGEQPLLRCDVPTGVVPARNTVDMRMLLSPKHRAPVRYSVMCALRPRAALDDAIPSGEEEHGDLLAPPQKLCEVHASAEFPLLQLVDARLQGTSQETVWKDLHLAEANEELASELSHLEHTLNSDEGLQGGGDVASITSMLRSVQLWLPPALLGAADTELHLLLRNTGGLNLSWSVRYPTEMELQIEHWADAGEPSAEELKQHMIVDKGILTISPKRGELPIGGSQHVTIRMRHMRADDYELPLLLKVAHGKQLVLNVRGRTLAAGELFLHVPDPSIELAPTPVGLPQPQRHTLELPNFGSAPLDYELLLDELHELNEQNFAFPVLQCPEPFGTIPPGSTALIPFGFQPLEAREYAVGIPVLVGPPEQQRARRAIVLRAWGFHPENAAVYDEHAEAEVNEMPPAQQLELAQQPMSLSFDRAVFGRVPQGSSSRQLVLLRNTSSTACAFEWDTSHPYWGSRVTVYPSHGLVQPGQHECCKVTLTGAGPPERVLLSLACKLQPQLPERAEGEEGAVARAVAGRGLAAGSGLAGVESLRSALHDGGSARRSVTDPAPKLRGILALQAAEERRARLAAGQALGKKMLVDSSAAGSPSATVVRLGVHATILPPDSLHQAGVDLGGFYLPRDAPSPEEDAISSLAASAGAGVAADASMAPSEGTGALPRDAAECFLEELLREVINSADVRHTLEAAPMHEVPWFAQLRPQASSVAAPAEAPPEVDESTLTEQELEDLEEERDRSAREAQRAAAREAEVEAEARRLAIKGSAELQELAAYVLEGTLFNLVSEASHGEFSLDVAPRQIVKTMDLTRAEPF